MKQRKQGIKGFLAGVLTVALVMGLALSAVAAMQEIRVSVGGIDIYVDGQLKVPVNVHGTRVDPIVYDGTTYLPVRAISNMLGKEVTWDGETSSIYIGKVPSKGSVGVPVEELKQFSGEKSVVTGSSAKYSILGDEYTPFNAIKFFGLPATASNGSRFWKFWDNGDITWKLNSNYRSIDGKFILAYDKLGFNGDVKISFYSVNQYGEETLIKTISNQFGDDAIDFHIDVTACDFVRVEYPSGSFTGPWDGGVVTAILYDITATTAD